MRDIALDIINFAQKKDIYEDRPGEPVTLILVCHVNKAGDLAGLLEIQHMVDVVTWFKGDREGKSRFFALEKNRFGPTHKRARFSMEETGLKEVIETKDTKETETDT